MDKRTLWFFLAFTLSLFGVNAFFAYQDQERNREWYAQQKAKKLQKIAQLEKEVADNTPNEQTLPIVSIYQKSNEEHLLGKGFLQEGILLAFGHSPFPETVWAAPSSASQRTAYTFKAEGPFGLGLYASSSDAKLSLQHLNPVGTYNLSLAHIAINDETPTEYHWGLWQEGTFRLPIKMLAKELGEKFSGQLPQEPALAFVKTSQMTSPIAIYDPANDSWTELASIPAWSSFIKEQDPTQSPSSMGIEEQFYVLENDYQQLVFSTYGGALAEINLPFQSVTNKKSIVKEIGFDREMLEDHPQNAFFPQHPYFTPEKTGDASYTFHAKGKNGGYYPLLRRDLIERPPYKTLTIRPSYYALNIVSEFPELAELVYEVKKFDAKTIVFEATQPHRRITKTYSLEENSVEAPYCFHLTIKIEGDSRGLWVTSGVPEVEWISGTISPALKYRTSRNQKAQVESISLPKDTITFGTVYPDWICNSNGFLGMILNPIRDTEAGFKAVYIPGASAPSRLIEIDQDYQRFKAADLPGYAMSLPLKPSGGTTRLRVFAGPFAESVLKTVDHTFSDPTTGYNPDYISCQSFHGWFAFISEPFAKFLFVLMKFFHAITHSWGFSIILLTFALRLILYPLNSWSMKSMIKMQELSPETANLQERYKKDPKRLQLEIANLYREKGVNPLSGCFPLLIQMPFLIGMFDLLKSTFELRGASFIPGWIDDLAAPDVLFRWHYPIFYIGNEFHLLPILLGLVMFIQQRMTAKGPKDLALMTEQQRQQRAMGNLMTILFAVMFYKVPSGLNIYWLSSMLLGMPQQWWIARKMKKGQKG